MKHNLKLKIVTLDPHPFNDGVDLTGYLPDNLEKIHKIEVSDNKVYIFYSEIDTKPKKPTRIRSTIG